MGISFKLKSELSVVRVAPDDVLNLRESPGAGAKHVGVLPHDARAVRATGKVCSAGESTWFEVARGDARGWANGAFLVPATPAKDVTPRVAKLLGPARFKSAEELSASLERALEKEQTEPQESPFEARLVGISRKGGLSAVFYVCCQADDSVMGEQLVLELADDAGTVSLRHAHASSLCWRGTSTGGLCL